jgi:hypothetical protein
VYIAIGSSPGDDVAKESVARVGIRSEGAYDDFQDNSAAIAWSEEDAHTKRSKHNDVRYHF